MNNMIILLVEDNNDVAKTLADLLLATLPPPVEIRSVDNAADAVYSAAHFDFNIILMDIGLDKVGVPVLVDQAPSGPANFDGCLTALAIRGLGFTGDLAMRASVPIVSLTGGLRPMDPTLYDLAKFVFEVKKPTTGHDLASVILLHAR